MLRTFRTNITTALHGTYGHCEGEHDDLLLALCCAVWAAEHSVYAHAMESR